jgi:hypothetical protein
MAEESKNNHSLAKGIGAGVAALIGGVLFFYCCIKCGGWLGRREVAKWEPYLTAPQNTQVQSKKKVSWLERLRGKNSQTETEKQEGGVEINGTIYHHEAGVLVDPYPDVSTFFNRPPLASNTPRPEGLDEFEELRTASLEPTLGRARRTPTTPIVAYTPRPAGTPYISRLDSRPLQRDEHSTLVPQSIPGSYFGDDSDSEDDVQPRTSQLLQRRHSIEVDNSDTQTRRFFSRHSVEDLVVDEEAAGRSIMDRPRRTLLSTLRTPAAEQRVTQREHGEPEPPLYTETRGEDGEGLPRYGDESTVVVAAGPVEHHDDSTAAVSPVRREESGLPQYEEAATHRES